MVMNFISDITEKRDRQTDREIDAETDRQTYSELENFILQGL